MKTIKETIEFSEVYEVDHPTRNHPVKKEFKATFEFDFVKQTMTIIQMDAVNTHNSPAFIKLCNEACLWMYNNCSVLNNKHNINH